MMFFLHMHNAALFKSGLHPPHRSEGALEAKFPSVIFFKNGAKIASPPQFPNDQTARPRRPP